MVFGLVSAIAGFVKVRYLIDKAVIDNVVFRLHYRLTSAILFLGCILCTANSLIGNPIQCIHNGGDKLDHAINVYCWVSTTHTGSPLQNSVIGTHEIAPGVRPIVNDDEKRFHSYYQWVPFVLFLQGILFYVPHWMWKNWEEGKVKNISEGLRGAVASTKAEQKELTSRLVRYIIESMSLHNLYALGYFIAEALNFFNVIFNIFFMDKFLGGNFLKLGLTVLNSNQDDDINNFPLHEIFPRLTKCTFYRYGPSGTPMNDDALCVLALNIINEKIYIFLWFWFIILAVISALALLYSVALIAFPGFRREILIRRFKFKVPQGVSTLVHKTKVGDFLLLHLLGQNINTTVFRDILEELSDKLSTTPPPTPNNLEMAPIYPTKNLYPSH